jgi:UDP-glucose 4-epimerase
MRILFTGTSSFTGYWFVKALAEAGHDVHALLTQKRENYQGVRKERVEKASCFCTLHEETLYGSPLFLELLEKRPFDLFCHHAADVTDYKSMQFNALKALNNNVGDLSSIMQKLKAYGCKKILLTGSVFEQGEGVGSDRLPAFSPYGLSKGLTSEMFKYYSRHHQLSLGKFVVPNPFGPLEEFRFTSFLMKEWKQKKEALVSMPAYIRDNIPVSLLAKGYVQFAESLPLEPGFKKFNPSGYAESQGAFTFRFAQAMRHRLKLPCAFQLASQTSFPEPKERTNTEPLISSYREWNESHAWDELAEYYQSPLFESAWT